MQSVPMVVKQSGNGERAYDIDSVLLEDRLVSIEGEVNTTSVEIVKKCLRYLNSIDSEKPIYLYINSPGGSVIDGLSLVNEMNLIKAPVYTIVSGMAASMGSCILSAGDKGHRFMLEDSIVMVHRMSGGTKGNTEDNIVNTNFEKRLEKRLIAKIGLNCGKISKKTYDEICKAVESLNDKDEDFSINRLLSNKAKKEYDEFYKLCGYDHYLFASQALEIGIVDHVIKSMDEITKLLDEENAAKEE